MGRFASKEETVIVAWSGVTGKPAWITGATTVGQNLITLANPGAITFIRLNANNSVSALSAADFKTALSIGGSMEWPGAGIPLSTGASPWGTSYTTTGSGTVIALAASPTLTGKITITSGVNDWGMLMNSPNSLGQSYGLGINAGTNTTDHALEISGAAGGDYLRLRGDGWLSLGHRTPTAPLHLSYTGTHKFRITHTAVSSFAVKSASDGTSWYMGGEHDRKLALGRNDIEDIVILPTTGNVTIRGGLHVGGESDPGDNNILVDGYIRSYVTPYASQTTGWNISQIGAGDFRYLYADELHAKAFIADLEQALAGGQIICKSVAPLAAVFTIPAAEAAATLVVESFKGFDTFKVFVDGDMIRLRQFDRTGTSLSITNTWGTVTWVSTDEINKTQTYTFTRSAAPNAGAGSGTIGIGVLALDYGTTGNGFLESNAIDGAMAANSPYHQTVTWTGHPNSGLVVKSRLGNLEGLAGYDIVPADPGYGLYSQNVYLSGKIVATSGYIGGVTGWAITAGSLIAGSGATRIELDTTTGIHMGATAFASAPFRVTPAGAMTATSGMIGGWSINSAYLAKDTGANITSAGMAPDDYPIFIGATYANRATAPFRVTPNGVATLTGLFIYGYTGVSNVVVHSHDAETSSNSVTYVKVKTITLGSYVVGDRTLRIKFDLQSNDGNQVRGIIYRNGGSVGAERTTTSLTYVTYSEDITDWSAGDLIELYIKSDVGGVSRADVQNLRVCGSHTILTNEITGTNS
ncbi:MAG TPA: hypothetical protein DDW27_12575 [Bacteroidales bacterium]|nr:hypothetical protein [Bacteroidales bacterium]